MTNALTILLFGLISVLSFGQQKELYLNDNFRIISEEEFLKESNNEFDYTLRFETDTTFVNIKVQREKKGKITLDILKAIKANLSTISKQEIDSDDILFINYYPGDGPCSTEGYKINFKDHYKKYHRKIKKLKNVKQFSIYKSPDNIESFGSEIAWLPDVKNMIEKSFYPIHYPCGGYVIIKSDGSFLSQRGEYCYSKGLIKQIKAFAKNNSHQ